MNKTKPINELLRITLGFIFLWAFLDKLFGFGFATTTDKSWLVGVSPTQGFLQFGTSGPLAPLFQNLAGNFVVDALFMTGLAAVGTSLLLGIGMQIASYSGSLMMALIYLAAFPPEHHPFLDEHIVYIFVLLMLKDSAGYKWGLRNKWKVTNLVKKHPILE